LNVLFYSKLKKMCPKVVLAAGFALAVMFQCACSTTMPARVRPLEREALAEGIMNLDGDSLCSAAAEHVYFSREAEASAGAEAAVTDATPERARFPPGLLSIRP
jgi:hypothetical protein